MADQFTITTVIELDNQTSGVKDSISRPNQTITQTTSGLYEEELTNTTSDTVLSLGNLASPSLLWIKNLDAANGIDVGPESGGALVDFWRIEAGEEQWIKLKAGAVVRWQADTASVQCWVKAYEL